jgi:hypothetical protein
MNSSFSNNDINSTTSVVTLEQIRSEVRYPTYRHILRAPTYLLEAMTKKLNDLLHEKQNDFNSNSESSSKAFERNEKKIDKLFNDMKALLKKQQNEAKIRMRNMTPEEANQELEFWQNFGDLFSRLVCDINTLFEKACIKIREGYILDRNILRDIFETISRTILSPFEQNLEGLKYLN